jgi:3',5'-cyclic AMP phosphodiesterase CpdA
VNFTLAHFSDLHLGPLPPGSAFAAFRSKRLLGTLSWHLRRKAIHQVDVAEALLRDVQAASPAHVAFTGDASNIASPLEFPRLRQWLDRLGKPDWISFIPGNHDAYVKVPYDKSLGLLAPFMAGDMPQAEPFPYVRLRRNIALIGLNSAVPRFYHSAQGRLGAAQRKALQLRLADLRSKGFCRVVMIHHPPGPGLSARLRALEDATPLRDMLCAEKVELVLHGHNHLRMFNWLEHAGTRVPAIGVPSASSGASHHPAEWNLYTFSRSAGAWRIDVQIRRWNPAQKSFQTVETFAVPAP